jgi:hypothetical protein
MKFAALSIASAFLSQAAAFSVAPGSASGSASASGSSRATTALSVTGGNSSPGVTSKTGGWELNKISPVVRIEGQTRHTFNFSDSTKELCQVAMHSPNARPIDSEVQLWIGPDWTPVSVKAKTEDGKNFPLQTIVGTRNMNANVEIRNNGPAAFPINAAASYAIPPLSTAREDIKDEEGIYIEGGAVKMAPFPVDVDQLQVLMTTEGKQLHAKIEMLNGPNNVKCEYEVFTNNGLLNALFVVFEMPGSGNAIRIKNLAPMEFPLKFYFKPSKIGKSAGEGLDWN